MIFFLFGMNCYLALGLIESRVVLVVVWLGWCRIFRRMGHGMSIVCSRSSSIFYC